MMSRRQFNVVGAMCALGGFELALDSRAYGANLNYSVPGAVDVIKQVGDTCWAYTATMMYNWRKQVNNTPDQVVGLAGPQFKKYFVDKTFLPFELGDAFFKSLGLKSMRPASYPPDQFQKFLKDYGLLWATTLGSKRGCNFSAHARIIRAITGDGAPASTNIKVIDPATGTQSSQSMTAFYKDFEAFAKAENSCDPDEPLIPQILHF